jgi:hypothetical protein
MQSGVISTCAAGSIAVELHLLTVMWAKYRVGAMKPPLAVKLMAEADLSLGKWIRAIATDSHFLVPFFVLLAGVALLVVLH